MLCCLLYSSCQFHVRWAVFGGIVSHSNTKRWEKKAFPLVSCHPCGCFLWKTMPSCRLLLLPGTCTCELTRWQQEAFMLSFRESLSGQFLKMKLEQDKQVVKNSFIGNVKIIAELCKMFYFLGFCFRLCSLAEITFYLHSWLWQRVLSKIWKFNYI